MSKPKSNAEAKQPSTPTPTPAPDPLSVQRGNYSRTLTFPKLLMAALRAISGPAQWVLIAAHPLGRLFSIPPPPTGGSITIPSISQLGLGAPLVLPKYPLMMALMPTVFP